MGRTVTILDVLDNFLTNSRAADFSSLTGRQLWRLGEEVRTFAENYQHPPADVARMPVYLGGWPSANFFLSDQGQLVLSTLLYSGQVYAKDPLSDWFTTERYRNERVMSGRQGYLNDDGSPNVAGTRKFLATLIPGLLTLRPLIESGALVLVPSEKFFSDNADSITELRSALMSHIGEDLDEVVNSFQPEDLAIDDRCRGLFVFAAGDRESQLRAAIDGSLRYFAREWLFAQACGAEYSAPWKYEQYVCEQGLGRLLDTSDHQRVVNALLHTELPVFQGLTPKVVASIRDDDTFADFRGKLFEVYKELPGFGPGPEFARHLAQTEEALLRPTLQNAEREARRGLLAKIGITLAEASISVGARVLYDAQTGQLGWTTAGREVVGVLADRVRFRGAKSPMTAWTKLYKHHRKLDDEVRRVAPQPGTHPDQSAWHIDNEPSMNVRITPGVLLFDDPPLAAHPGGQANEAYSDGPYRPCECGSGYKWKFCCKDLRR